MAGLGPSRLSAAITVAALLMPTGAVADPRTSTETPRAKKPAMATAAPPNFDALMGLVDKIFPPQPAPDAARLALARTSARAMWPDGAYAAMMSGFLANIFTGIMQVKKADLAPLSPKASRNSEGPASDRTIAQEAAAKDPNFNARMGATRGVIDEEISKISVVIDPRMREGLARSLARRLDQRQLSDINAFFETPSGQALSSQFVKLWFEPDTLRAMMGALPEMMKLMPDATQKLKAVNDKYPKPPKPRLTTAAPKPGSH